MPKRGVLGWKPISETRHASIKTVYQVRCNGCDSRHMIFETTDLEHAKVVATMHDAGHATDVAECCMHSTAAVCECGNVLV